MAKLPDVPGKSVISGMTKGTRVVVAAAGTGALAVGGLVAKRVLGHRGKDGDDGTGASADPIAETPTAPPGAEEKPVPKGEPVAVKPKPAKPAPAKPKADKPKPAKAKADKPKPKPAKAKAEPEENVKPAPKAKAAKPAKAKAKAKPAKAMTTGGKGPHAELNNPVVDDPDLTEYPDPYDTREDPRDPVDPDGAPFGKEPHPLTGSESTSEPPLSQDPEVIDGGKPPKRDKLDD
jgi:hypothetical protein